MSEESSSTADVAEQSDVVKKLEHIRGSLLRVYPLAIAVILVVMTSGAFSISGRDSRGVIVTAAFIGIVVAGTVMYCSILIVDAIEAAISTQK